MQRRWWKQSLIFTVGCLSRQAHAATRPVPVVCNATVNAGFVSFLQKQQSSGREAQQDNVMVCGTMLRDSYTQHAGHSGTGAHEILVLSVPMANGTAMIEVVTNDALDGKVTASKGDAVFAYGQAYVDAKPIHAAGLTLVAGLHDTHCSTHAGADDGWVVVAGKRYPAGSCTRVR